MSTALFITLALLGQPKSDPDQFPLALHRSMELDDLDREIQRLHDTVLLRRAQFNSTQRLSSRGLASRSDVERDSAAYRYEEAHEAETIAYRALKAHERDVMGHAVPPDEIKSYTLLLDWLKKQETMGQVDLDYREFTLRQNRILYQRKAISRQELEDADLNYNTAQATVALSRSRQAQVAMEIAARRGEKPYDAAEYERLKSDYLKARLQYYEIVASGAHSRLAIAQERSRRGLIPASELAIFVKAAEDADAAVSAEREKMEKTGSQTASKTS